MPVFNTAALFGSVGDATYSIGTSFLPDNSSGYWSSSNNLLATNSGSIWVQRNLLGSIEPILDNQIFFNADNRLVIWGLTSDAVYRDTTAPYHIQWNSTEAYVNGVRVTGTGSYATAAINNVRIGFDGTNYSDLYFSGGRDLALYSGSDVLTGGEFVEGNWDPIAPTPTPTYDLTDFTVQGTITSASNTPTNVESVLNALDTQSGTLSNGNRSFTRDGSGDDAALSSLAIPDSGEWWATCTSGGGTTIIGVLSNGIKNRGGTLSFTTNMQDSVAYSSNGDRYIDGTAASYGATYTASDVIGIHRNVTAGEITFYKQTGGSGAFVSQGTITYARPDGPEFFFVMESSSASPHTWNFTSLTGAPSGAQLLAVRNFDEVNVTLSDHLVHNDYTGNGGSQVISFTDTFGNAVDWGSDDYLIVFKYTSSAGSWYWFDRVRGVNAWIASDRNGGVTNASDILNTFTGTSVTIGNEGGRVNANGTEGYYFAIRAGTAASNTDGTITAQVSTNTTLGFSIVHVNAAGTGAAATIGHNLGREVGAIIGKRLDTSGDWPVYHCELGATQALFLNSTAGANTSNTWWNNTAPTNSVFSVGTAAEVNASGGSYVFYVIAKDSPLFRCFGYSGNADADGVFSNLSGFNIINIDKGADTSNAWGHQENVSNPHNVRDETLLLNTSGAQSTQGNQYLQDGTATGRKIRTSSSNLNGSNDYVSISVVEPFGSNRMPRGR